MSSPGRFITFEGPEGSGKTTQLKRLVGRLRERSVVVLICREPGGTPTGEAIRDILQHDATGEEIVPEAEALLFAASRAQLVHARILPALREGQWVLCDRFADSTTAYQGYGRAFGAARMQPLNEFAADGTVPDRTFLIDIEPMQARTREGYLAMAKEEPGRFVVIDGTGLPGEIEEQIWRSVERDFINR